MDLSMSSRTYEPEPSNRLYSPREMRWKSPEHIGHRFPIKGGISLREVVGRELRRNLTEINPMSARFAKMKALG